MPQDPITLAQTAVGQLPFNRLVGLQVVEAASGRAVTTLALRAELVNHIGTLHAGALFTLAEAASGAVVASSFAEVLGRSTPLVTNVEIQYKAPAPGECRADATLDGIAVERVRADLEAGRRTTFDVAVQVSTEGKTAASAIVRWVVLFPKS